jgi:CRISPR-associated protein Cas2
VEVRNEGWGSAWENWSGKDLEMLVLITYDVNTETAAGRKRLQKIAKVCVDYGQRVQNSVFECNIDAALLRVVKQKLIDLMDRDTDSLRLYFLGNTYKNKIEHYGTKASFDVTDPLIV